MRLKLLEFLLGWIIYILYDLFWKNNEFIQFYDWSVSEAWLPYVPTFKQIAWFYHKRHMHQQNGIWCNAKAINLKTVFWNDLFPFTFFTLQFLPYNWTINYWIKISFLTVPAFNAKSFAIAILVFFSFFPSRHFFWTDCQKLFRVIVLIFVIKKTCDQDLAHSLDTTMHIFIKIVPEVVIHDACGTWHGLCTVTSIYNVQKSTRNCQNRPPETRKQVILTVDGRRFKAQNREKSSR